MGIPFNSDAVFGSVSATFFTGSGAGLTGTAASLTAGNATTFAGKLLDLFPYAYTNGALGTVNSATVDGGPGADALNRSCFFRDNNVQFGALGINISHPLNAGYAFQIAASNYNLGAGDIIVRSQYAGAWGATHTLRSDRNFVAGTHYLSPNGSAASLTGFTTSQITNALGFTPINKAGDTVTGTLNGGHFRSSNATEGMSAFGALIAGDTVQRVVIQANGNIAWSNGATASDVSIGRTSAGVLSLNGNVIYHAGNFDPASKASLTGATFTGSVNVNSGGNYSTLSSNDLVFERTGGPSYLCQRGIGGSIIFKTSASAVLDTNALTIAANGAVSIMGNNVWHAGNLNPATKLDATATAADSTKLGGVAASGYSLTSHNHSGTYQPLDADLTAIAGLSGTTGFLKKTAADTWTLEASAGGGVPEAPITGALHARVNGGWQSFEMPWLGDTYHQVMANITEFDGPCVPVSISEFRTALLVDRKPLYWTFADTLSTSTFQPPIMLFNGGTLVKVYGFLDSSISPTANATIAITRHAAQGGSVTLRSITLNTNMAKGRYVDLTGAISDNFNGADSITVTVTASGTGWSKLTLCAEIVS